MAAFQPWLTPDPPVIKTANAPLSTAARSLFVGIHSWQAWDTNISYRYLSFTTLPETFTVPRCLSGNRQQRHQQPACLFFHRAPSGFTLLQQHGHNSLKLIFSVLRLRSKRWRADWLTGDPSLPALLSLPASLVAEEGRTERRWPCRNDLGKRQRMNLSPLLTASASPPPNISHDAECCRERGGCAALNVPTKRLFLPIINQLTYSCLISIVDVKRCIFLVRGKAWSTRWAQNPQSMDHDWLMAN